MPGPDIWGPPGWKFIHYVTLGYPDKPSDDIKKKYYDYFISLKNVIPCSVCANHYAANLEKTPLNDAALSNKDTLIKWGIDMHNHVNKLNNKRVYTYDEAFILMLSGFPDNKNNDVKIVEKIVEKPNVSYLIICIIIIIILLAILYLKHHKKI
jgi:hypothetical protein